MQRNKKKYSSKKVPSGILSVLLFFILLPLIFSGDSKDKTTPPIQTQQMNTTISGLAALPTTLLPTPTRIPTAPLTSTATVAPISSTLRKGDKGEEVKALQNRLIELGYLTGAPDGDFGNRTRAAIIDFQKMNDLNADGVVGNKTITSLYSNTVKRQVWVWIPTRGGKKYHSKPSCSNMIEPEKVTYCEAIKRGFGDCGKCKPYK